VTIGYPDLRMIELRPLIEHWKSDPGGTYQTWFLWKNRLRNFGAIRRGLGLVVREVHSDTFGNLYRGSSLETVVKCVAEQKQIFKGADHAFLWKPKLRIPDIYESRQNQLAFGAFLDTCCCCSTEPQLLAAIHRLYGHSIKGLGPAAANLLYFLHPTHIPPFNTAIVKGYNALTGSNVKLEAVSRNARGDYPDQPGTQVAIVQRLRCNRWITLRPRNREISRPSACRR
jgi:type II restriction enzyme